MAEYLGVAAHPHVAPAEIILEAAVDPLGGAALVVAHVLGKRVASLAPAPRLGRERFLSTRHVAGMRVDDRHVTEGDALGLDLRRIVGAVHQIVEVDHTGGCHRCQGIAAWLSCNEAEVSTAL